MHDPTAVSAVSTPKSKTRSKRAGIAGAYNGPDDTGKEKAAYLRCLRCIFFDSAEIRLPVNISLTYRQMRITAAIVIVNMAGC